MDIHRADTRSLRVYLVANSNGFFSTPRVGLVKKKLRGLQFPNPLHLTALNELAILRAIGLFQRKDGLEKSRKHADDGEHGGDGLDVVVQEPVDGDPQPPLLPVLLQALEDLVVAVTDAQVRR
jgi:hypothetical protein